MARCSFAQKRVYKPEKLVASTDVALYENNGLEVSLCSNNGVWRKMNGENGTCDVDVMRRGLNVQG